ncbi:MAG: peptidoglycan-binding protein [Patescibacteria group bacterium]
MKRNLKLLAVVMVLVTGLIMGSHALQTQAQIAVCPAGYTCYPNGGPTPACPVGQICQPITLNCPSGFTCYVTLLPIDPPEPLTDATVAVVAASARLSLQYDGNNKESALISSFEMLIDGGTKGVNVYKKGGVSFGLPLTTQGNLTLPNTIAPQAIPQSGVDNTGRAFWIIPAGSTFRFASTGTTSPKQLFAGTYTSYITGVSGVKGTDANNYVSLVPKVIVKSNPVTIIGEVSPFISSLGSPGPYTPGSGITVNGQRLDTVDHIMIDGNIHSVATKGDASNIGFALPENISGGHHTLQLRSNTVGDSNAFSFEVRVGSCYQFQVNLEVGSQGTDVSELQKFLNAKGFPVDVTGYFGELTKDALINYQTSVGLPATGYFGPLTRTLVNSNCEGTPSITVLNPTGGETLKTGDDLLVRFTTNLPVGTWYNIALSDTSGTYYTSLLQAQINEKDVQGSSVTIPNATPGEYFIRVIELGQCLEKNCTRGDSKYFTIPGPVHDAKVTVLRSLLDLVLDGTRQESLLKNTMIISVVGGTTGIYIYEYQGAMGFYDALGNSADVSSKSSEAWKAVSGGSQTVYDSKGSKMYYVKPGITVQFSSVNTIQPKQMFAGTYYATLKSIFANTGTSVNTSFYFNAPANKSPLKTIVGEKSPYITSVTNPVRVGNKFAINGVRLSSLQSFGTVFIDGVKTTALVDGSRDGTVLFFVLPSLSAGQHYVHVNNPTTGDSNRAYFDVSEGGVTQASINSISPTSGTSGTQVTILGKNFQKGNYIRVSGKGFEIGVIPDQSSVEKMLFTMPQLPADTGTYDVQVGYGDVLSNRVYFYVNTGTPTTPPSIRSITASAPVSGQTYNPAYPLKVSWTQNYASNAVSIRLYGGNNSPRDLGTYPAKKGDNSIARQIGNLNLINGSYSLEVCDDAVEDPQQPGKSLCGMVRFFNIETPTTAPTSNTLTLVKGGTNNGTVIAEGTTCTSTCTLTVPSDKPIVITATPSNPTTMFTGWSGGGCSGTARTCTVTVAGNTTVTATFGPAVTVSSSKRGTGKGTITGGDINCGSTCAMRLPLNGSVTLTATPEVGSVFTGWAYSGCSGTGTCTITSATAAIKTVTATFDLAPAQAASLSATLVSVNESVVAGESANDDVGVFSITYRLTASGGAAYIPSNFTDYIVEKSGSVVSSANIGAVVVNNTDLTQTSSGNYKIEDGDSETFTLTVSVPNGGGLTAGQYRMRITGIKWGSTDTNSSENTYSENLGDFNTDYAVLNALPSPRSFGSKNVVPNWLANILTAVFGQ